MDYKSIFLKLSESEDISDETTDSSEIDYDNSNVEESEIKLGSLVKVLDASSYTATELVLDDDEFESFKLKVEDGLSAIVFDIDDDNTDLVDIVYEDGLEIFNLPKLNLEIVENEL